jgi:predicted transcriptional regulator
MDYVVRRVNQMHGSQITRGIGRVRKTIRQIVKNDLEINELDRNMVYDRTL